jgi:hypothetical protein
VNVDEYLEALREYLTEEGYRPRDSEDRKSLNFKHEGTYYYVDSNSKAYVRFGCPGIYTIANLEQRGIVERFCGEVTRELKAVKAYVYDGEVHCTVEQFIPEPEDIKFIFPRALNALQAGTKEFLQKIGSGN